MKIHEYNEMMRWLTKPGKVLGNNINNKKISNTERQRLAKGTKPDTKVTPKNSKMLQYIEDHKIVEGDKKASKAEAEAAAKRIESYQEQYNKYFNKKSPKYFAKIPVIPPKPDLVNGHSDWDTDTWLEQVDPGGWSSDEDKRSGLLEFELADEYWQDQFQNYQNNGGTLNFQQFMQMQIQQKVNKEINKRIKNKMRTEGIVEILGLPGNKI